MAKLDWLKMWHDARTDPKLRTLSDFHFRYWFQMLLLASEQEERGCIDLSDVEEVCLQIGLLDENDDPCLPALEEVVAVLIKRRLAVRDEDVLMFPAFIERQYDKPSDRPEAVKERVTRHRKASGNADVTPCNAVKRAVTHREEKRESREEEIEIKGGGYARAREDTPPSFDECYEAYPVHRFEDEAKTAFDDVVSQGADPGDILAACKAVSRSTRQSLGKFLTEKTWRDFLPKPSRAPCTNPDCINGFVMHGDEATPCPICKEVT